MTALVFSSNFDAIHLLYAMNVTAMHKEYECRMFHKFLLFN